MSQIIREQLVYRYIRYLDFTGGITEFPDYELHDLGIKTVSITKISIEVMSLMRAFCLNGAL